MGTPIGMARRRPLPTAASLLSRPPRRRERKKSSPPSPKLTSNGLPPTPKVINAKKTRKNLVNSPPSLLPTPTPCIINDFNVILHHHRDYGSIFYETRSICTRSNITQLLNLCDLFF